MSSGVPSPTSEPDDVCMVFDDHGNAFDAFPYTPEELEYRAKVLRGLATIRPSPFVISASAEVDDE